MVKDKAGDKPLIIFDETDGMSLRGAFMKRLAKNRGIKYVTTSKELVELLEDETNK